MRLSRCAAGSLFLVDIASRVVEKNERQFEADGAREKKSDTERESM